MDTTQSSLGTGSTGHGRLLALAKGLVAMVLMLLVLAWIDVRDRIELPRPEGPLTLHGVYHLGEGTAQFLSHDGRRVEITTGADGRPIAVTVFPPAAPGEPERFMAEEHPWVALVSVHRGILSLWRGMAPRLLGAAFAGYLAAIFVCAVRWRMLLRSVGFAVGLWPVLRLTFLGLFGNNFVPGLTGGDLIKAIYIARANPGRRADAAISVVVDRITGLTGLALIAAVVVWTDLDRFGVALGAVYGVLGVFALATTLLFSRRLRARIGSLPVGGWLRKVDRSILLYRDRPGVLAGALGLSVIVQLIILTGIGALGVALHLGVPFLHYYALVPMAIIVQSLPISPQGLGVGELAFVFFFAAAGVPSSGAVALSLSYRLVMTVASLPGGVVLATERAGAGRWRSAGTASDR